MKVLCIKKATEAAEGVPLSAYPVVGEVYTVIEVIKKLKRHKGKIVTVDYYELKELTNYHYASELFIPWEDITDKEVEEARKSAPAVKEVLCLEK